MKKNIVKWIPAILFTLFMTLLILSGVESSTNKIEVITVSCEMYPEGESLPLDPMLFQEVEEFIKYKNVISVDYEVERTEDYCIKKAVIIYK